MEICGISFPFMQKLNMVNLNDIAVFVKVAQFKSFSRAALAMSMPVSTVSRAVSNLEEQLGVTLLQRTTRKLSLTGQGRDYYNQCNGPLSDLYDAESVLTQIQKNPEGTLRITVPVIMGQEPFYKFLSDFQSNYPKIKIDLFITNTYLDLIAENLDVGIRFGGLKDSTLITKRIGTSIRYVVAAPDYLKGRSPPSRPQDLMQHQCVILGGRNNETEWELVNGRKKTKVEVAGPIASRDFQSVSDFTYRGHGIGLLPMTYCDEQIRNGKLVRLLPAWSSPEIVVHSVYPTRKFLPSRLHVFLEALKAWKSPFWLLLPTPKKTEEFDTSKM